MKQKGRGTLESIATANKNLEQINTLLKPKPPKQQLGQIIHFPITKRGYGRRRRIRGVAALVDRYGAYTHAF